jgi:hypothetical protein
MPHLAIFDGLAAADEYNTMRQHDLFVGLSRLGQLELSAGAPRSALVLFERALGIANWLVQADPNNADAHFSLVQAHGALVRWAMFVGEETRFKAHIETAREFLAGMAKRGQLRGFEARADMLAGLEELARVMREHAGWDV